MTSCGMGEGTTRRHPRPASSTTCQPKFAARFLCFFFIHETADGFAGILESRVIRVHTHLADDRGYRLIDTAFAQLILQRLSQ